MRTIIDAGSTWMKSTVRRTVRPLAVTVLALALASCVTGATRKLTTGDIAGAAKGDGRSYAELSVEDHYSVCSALLSLQRFSDLDQCMAPLKKRAYSESFDAGGGFGTYTKDYIDILLNAVEAKKYYAIGEFDAAYRYAEKAYAASKRDPRVLMNKGLALYTSIATLGLNNPNAKDSYRAEISRRMARVEPHGLMAIIETRRGRGDAAEFHRSELRQLYAAADKSTVENAFELATMPVRMMPLRGMIERASPRRPTHSSQRCFSLRNRSLSRSSWRCPERLRME